MQCSLKFIHFLTSNFIFFYSSQLPKYAVKSVKNDEQTGILLMKRESSLQIIEQVFMANT